MNKKKTKQNPAKQGMLHWPTHTKLLHKAACTQPHPKEDSGKTPDSKERWTKSSHRWGRVLEAEKNGTQICTAHSGRHRRVSGTKGVGSLRRRNRTRLWALIYSQRILELIWGPSRTIKTVGRKLRNHLSSPVLQVKTRVVLPCSQCSSALSFYLASTLWIT